VVTNRLPRRALTVFMGWFARIEQPLVRDLSIGAWQWFDPTLDLTEARKTRFTSLHDCFVRELRDGARPIDRAADVLVSPCDGIVGAHGRVDTGWMLQAKGERYRLAELLCDEGLAAAYVDGTYVTLRLTSAMYHRFHAPGDGEVNGVTYVPGDVWNVNPPALRRVARLFCRNERAILRLAVDGLSTPVLLVPIAAILVASIRLHVLGGVVRGCFTSHRPCACRVARGDELGWFEHGSTIVVIAPRGVALGASLRSGDEIRMGQPILRLADHDAHP
jgi:phosphatidylserine decarboxylase